MNEVDSLTASLHSPNGGFAFGKSVQVSASGLWKTVGSWGQNVLQFGQNAADL